MVFAFLTLGWNDLFEIKEKKDSGGEKGMVFFLKYDRVIQL